MVIDWRLIGAIWFGLLMFGCAFGGLVWWIGDRKQGYTSLLVVLGVLITLLGVALVSWQAALLTGGFFTASGLPMILGDILKHAIARERSVAELKKLAIKEAEEIE